MIVVSDASVLNYLLQIQAENFLVSLFTTIVVPPIVRTEMAGPPAHPRFQQLLSDRIVTVAEISGVLFFQSLLQTLGRGEAEAIVLAKEWRADYLLIDERLGDAMAKERTASKPSAVPGILIEGKKAGYINLVKPHPDSLASLTNCRMSKHLYQTVLSLAGE